MKSKEKDELDSLNEKLYDEFYVQELEERLETDPLLIGGLLDFFSDSNGDIVSTPGRCSGTFHCSGEFSCSGKYN